MKGRTGFIIGVGVGYVLGAKAGRQPAPASQDTDAQDTDESQYEAPQGVATARPATAVQKALSAGLRAAGNRLRR